jgi:hypothetical protein
MPDLSELPQTLPLAISEFILQPNAARLRVSRPRPFRSGQALAAFGASPGQGDALPN